MDKITALHGILKVLHPLNKATPTEPQHIEIDSIEVGIWTNGLGQNRLSLIDPVRKLPKVIFTYCDGMLMLTNHATEQTLNKYYATLITHHKQTE